MKKDAAYRDPANPRLRLASLCLSVAAAMLLLGLGSTASAAPVGKDGKIHACYRVKGKPKGVVRVVRSARARCRRGERKVAWSVSGSAGQPGAVGQAGQPGSSSGGGANEAALKAQVGALSLRVETLEGILQGITNADLLSAVSSLPLLEPLCEQSSAVTEQLNSLQGVVGGLGLEGVLGGLLTIPPLPEEVDPLDCSSF